MSIAGKRIAVGVAMAAVVAGITASATAANEIHYKPLESSQPVVMTINGAEVRADEYASYIKYNMKYYEDMYSQYGLVGLWEDDEAAEMIGASMPEAASEQAIYTKVLLENFDKENLKMDGPHQQRMRQMKTQMLEQAAQVEAMRDGKNADEVDEQKAYESMIGNYGFTPQLYENFMYVSECYAMLEEKLFGENGTQAPSDEELLQYFKDNYLAAKHILIQADGQNHTDEEARELAEQALARLNAGESFDTVMNELTEDPGTAANPNGYIFTEGDMVDEFYEAAKSLKENEISDLVPTSFGYHIVQRVPLNAEQHLDEYREILCEKMGKTMDNLVSQWMDEADVQTTDLYDEITYKNVQDYAPATNTDDTDDASDADDQATGEDAEDSDNADDADSADDVDDPADAE